jgi:hypothetical protein
MGALPVSEPNNLLPEEEVIFFASSILLPAALAKSFALPTTPPPFDKADEDEDAGLKVRGISVLFVLGVFRTISLALATAACLVSFITWRVLLARFLALSTWAAVWFLTARPIVSSFLVASLLASSTAAVAF